MSSPSLLLLTSLVVAALGCASDPSLRGFVPSKGQAFAIEAFSLEGAEVRYDGPYERFGMDLAQNIATRFDRLGFPARAIARGETAEPGSALVTGRIVKLDRGHRALRATIGFGAGKAWVVVAGEVRDPNGVTVGQFSTKRYASTGVFGGSAKGSIDRCLASIANEVANMVRHGTYRELPGVSLEASVMDEPPPQEPAPAEPEPETLPFSACFERCLELTDRTREECFDACSGR